MPSQGKNSDNVSTGNAMKQPYGKKTEIFKH